MLVLALKHARNHVMTLHPLVVKSAGFLIGCWLNGHTRTKDLTTLAPNTLIENFQKKENTITKTPEAQSVNRAGSSMNSQVSEKITVLFLRAEYQWCPSVDIIHKTIRYWVHIPQYHRHEVKSYTLKARLTRQPSNQPENSQSSK